MSFKDMVESAKKAAPGPKGLPDDKAAALLREVFRQLGQRVEAATDGEVVKVPGFGNFRIKMIEREKDGQKAVIKRVVFLAAKTRPKADKPKGEVGRGKANAG